MQLKGNMSKPIVVETGANPDSAVIWLHGLGANGHDFVPVVPELNLPAELQVRFIFPNAPNIPVTINGGMVMPAWYDILELSLNRKVDADRLRESARMVHGLIEEQMAQNIDSERIVLAGFSQGGAVVYEAALTCSHRLAGLMAMSTYFATAESIQLNIVNAGLPVAIYHGTRDPMVQEAAGHGAADVLRAMGFEPEYKTYPMEHMVCLEQIRDIGAKLTSWLR